MMDAAATFSNVPSLDGRFFPIGDCRRAVNGVGLGTMVAVCVFATIVTVAAAWIINAALAANPYSQAHPTSGPTAQALAKYGPNLASAADVFRSARVSTAPADSPDVTFETKWARATASTLASTVPLVSVYPFERASNVPLPRPPPLEVSHRRISRFSSNLPLAPKLTAKWATSVPLPRPHPAKHEVARSPVSQARFARCSDHAAANARRREACFIAAKSQQVDVAARSRQPHCGL